MTAQALPNDVPNLAQMFQNLPAIAAYQSGAQQGLADDNNALLQQAHIANQQNEALKRPLELAELVARTNQHNATAGFTTEETRGRRLGNDYTEKTQPGKIAADQAGFSAAERASQLKQMEAEGQLYGQLATQMEGMTPWERVNLVKTHFKDKLPPGIEAGLMRNAATLPDWMKKLSQHSYEQSAAARKAADLEEMKLAVARQMGVNSANVADINAAGKVAAKNAGGGAGGKGKPLTMSQFEAQIRAAAETGDPEAVAALQRLEADRQARAQAAGAPADAIKRGVLRLPPKAAVPGATVPSTAPSAAPAAAPGGWVMPKDWKDNKDGTYTLPDGRRIRRTAQ
jgi:hypothetical protein